VSVSPSSNRRRRQLATRLCEKIIGRKRSKCISMRVVCFRPPQLSSDGKCRTLRSRSTQPTTKSRTQSSGLFGEDYCLRKICARASFVTGVSLSVESFYLDCASPKSLCVFLIFSPILPGRSEIQESGLTFLAPIWPHKRLSERTTSLNSFLGDRCTERLPHSGHSCNPLAEIYFNTCTPQIIQRF
jgi:hypothetical protein